MLVTTTSFNYRGSGRVIWLRAWTRFKGTNCGENTFVIIRGNVFTNAWFSFCLFVDLGWLIAAIFTDFITTWTVYSVVTWSCVFNW